MILTPINMAEAIIDACWDPQLSKLSAWEITPGDVHGLRVWQGWCFLHFEWAHRPVAGPALRMTRRFDVTCADYDRLLVSVMAPEGAVVRLIAETDYGTEMYTAPPAGKLKKELALDLRGATVLHTLTLEVDAAGDGVATGWFNWIGLQNSALLPRYLAQWQRFDARWDGYLQPESYQPSFTPTHGILINGEELAALRTRHAAFLRAHGTSPFVQAAEAARQLTPEQMIHEYVNFWGDTRYCRERDHGKHLLTHGPNAAIAGLLLEDPALLRLGARYALSLAMCGRWDDGMICNFPGGTFDHRCFVQSLCAHETVLLLDLAGDLFTDLGRDLLLRRIGEEGLGAIDYNTWKYEYIFHCNQLAWFTPGRMLGSAVLERYWPRAKAAVEQAHIDLVESLGYAVLPDGGYVEGPTYFTCVGRSGGLSLYYYARARGLDFASLLPESMLRTADFGAVITSSDDAQDVIPICDAGNKLDIETLAVMSAALPRSQWTAMFRKAAARTGMPNSILACTLEASIPTQAPEPPPFVFLPVMGVMASTRQLEGETVKLLIMGNHAGAGHTHEDKGSFVLEFAGETFAMDPGTCDYSSPFSALMQNCERHNMLLPTGMPERPHPQCPLPMDVKPRGSGDAVAFHATLDATPGWTGYYTTWQRTWESPTPDTLLIHDTWELASGDAVEWCWHTRREMQVDGNTVTLTGQRGLITLTAPADCTIRVDVLPMADGTQQRIVFRRKETAGSMTVRVKMRVQKYIR